MQNNDIPVSNKYKLLTDAPSNVPLTIAEPNIISGIRIGKDSRHMTVCACLAISPNEEKKIKAPEINKLPIARLVLIAIAEVFGRP